VVERVSDLPAGVLGFRASGKITSDEYVGMMAPIYASLEPSPHAAGKAP
jgi:hypothetical protein